MYVCLHQGGKISLSVLLDRNGWFEEDRKLDIDAANKFVKLIELELNVMMDINEHVVEDYKFLKAVDNKLAFKTDEDLPK